MKYVHRDGTAREQEWAEPVVPRAPSAAPGVCPSRTNASYVWAVPTQEGFALQLNSLLSMLTLAARLRRVAVVMPLLATGPHYRAHVATQKMAPTIRMDRYVNFSASLARAPGFGDVRYRRRAERTKPVSAGLCGVGPRASSSR